MTNDIKYSLIIPCYNESKNLPLLLERCKALQKPGVEVILVDNGSTDDSQQVLATFLPNYANCRSIRVDINQGYGFGILSGLRVAKGEILGWTHADLQTDPSDFLKGISFFKGSSSGLFVKGRRRGRPLSDTIFTLGMSLFETFLFRKGLFDINAQPTTFSRVFFDTWRNPPHDFSLDLFAYVQAKNQGLSVMRFPVIFGKRAFGVSHWNINWASKKKFIERTLEYSFELRKLLELGK